MLAHFARDIPFDSFLFGLFAVAMPFLATLRAGSGVPDPQWSRRYRRMVVAIAVALAVTAAIRYLVAAHPAVDGVDFYFYLCFGRDLLNGVADPTLAKYAYFPGGYRFWELVMALFGEDLSTLRLVFVCLLAANAVLCGAVAWRCLKSASAGVLTGLWYLALASRFEGLDGTTEPISTLFALAGVLAWGGEPLRGATGWRRALLLGAGLGLAVWVKQPGGLVAIGASIIAINYLTKAVAVRDSFWQMAAIPAAATCVLLVAVLLEGHGLAPLVAGLRHVAEYEAYGSLMNNLSRLARQAGPAYWLILVALYFWAAILLTGFSSVARQPPWTAIVGFSLIAAFATFLQFSKRDSPHYGLLAAPYLAIAVCVMAVRATQVASAIWPRMRPFIAIATVGVLVQPAVGSRVQMGHFQVWPVAWNPAVTKQERWHEDPDVAADLQSLALVVEPGEDVLLIPPRRNAAHFLLGSVSLTNPHGYGWGPQDALQTISTPSLDTVLVLHPRTLRDGDAKACKFIGCDRAIAALPGNGFRVSVVLTSMTLWRRESPEPFRTARLPGIR